MDVGVQFGAQRGVAVGVFEGLGVDVITGVGAPMALFVRITSVTPLPISTTAFPSVKSMLMERSGLTSIKET